MVKRILCFGMVISIVLSVCGRQVKAEPIIEVNEGSTETVDEMIKDYDEEMAKIDEMYENLEITLPEKEFVWNEETIETTDNISRAARIAGTYHTGGTATNTNLVWSMDNANRFEGSTVHQSPLAEVFYTFGTKVKSSFVLPGMSNTNVAGRDCDDMTPQGITYYDGYYFITAYCYEKEHNSVIYVIDGSSKNLITTLVLDGMLHAGGIAYANGYLWICDTSKMYYYKYSEIDEIITFVKGDTYFKSVSINGCVHGHMNIPNSEEASFITTYNGYLCIGSYQKILQSSGSLRFYYPTVSSGGTMNYIASFELPKYAQGVSFYTYNGYTYMMITTSTGFLDSCAYIYRRSGTIYSGALTHTKKIYLPCYAEEAVTVGGYTYFVYESCAKAYRNSSIPVIGKVCGMENAFVYK